MFCHAGYPFQERRVNTATTQGRLSSLVTSEGLNKTERCHDCLVDGVLVSSLNVCFKAIALTMNSE